jgi:ornithine carbamoyltransferase
MYPFFISFGDTHLFEEENNRSFLSLFSSSSRSSSAEAENRLHVQKALMVELMGAARP